MSSTTAQVSFAAEFVTMLVAASALALVVRRSALTDRPLASRLLLGVGFSILGVGAFLHGSLIVGSSPGLGVSRLVGVALIGAGVRRWTVGLLARVPLVAGLILLAAAAAVGIGGGPTVVGDGLLIVGSPAVGLPLVVAGRQSIATRVAVASAATLLLVLLVVSIAMSQVISSSVTSQDLSHLAQRARTESVQAATAANGSLKDARFVAGDLQGYFHAVTPDPLVDLSTGTGARTAARTAVQDRLNGISQLYPVGGFVYVLPGASLVVSSSGVDNAATQAVAGAASLRATSCTGGGSAHTLVEDNQVWAVGSFPECGANGAHVLGTVLSVTPLDAAYLVGRRQADPSVSLAIVAPGRVLAASGAQPSPATLVGFGARAAASKASATQVVGDHFVSVEPLPSGLAPQSLAVVASTTTASLVSTRQKLFQTLFLIALGSTLGALALAVIVGEQITAGVRRLTDVAGRIQAGEASERAGALGTDEVGMLGAAFDSMIDSVEDQAAALQAAADIETRLRNRLEAVVAGIGDSLVAVDIDGRVIELNAAAETFFGVDAAAARGSPVRGIIHGTTDTGQPLGELLARSSAAGSTLMATVRAVDAAEVPVAISAGAVRGPAGELIGSVLVLRDLRSEQELERMKTEFLSRVGHELRTPLTGIMGYTDILLRRHVEPERARAWHEEIRAGAKKLLRIVEMLEFFASSGAGRVRLRPQPLDLRSLVAGVTAKWNDRLTDHHLVRRVDPSTPQVLADRRWLVLLMDELIDNAVKFSPAGGRISLTVEPVGATGSGDAPEGAVNGGHPGNSSQGPGSGLAPASGPARGSGPAMVQLAVIDEGEGMTPEQQAAAFGEFVQLDESDTRRFGGLGLGLPLVQRVAEGHGGAVTCASAPGRGSTFTVTLPALPVGTEVGDDLSVVPTIPPGP